MSSPILTFVADEDHEGHVGSFFAELFEWVELFTLNQLLFANGHV